MNNSIMLQCFVDLAKSEHRAYRKHKALSQENMLNFCKGRRGAFILAARAVKGYSTQARVVNHGRKAVA